MRSFGELHFQAFPKYNRHFDEFLFHEKMAWKMEDFPCLRLAFWRGRGQAGESESVYTFEKRIPWVFRLVSARTDFSSEKSSCYRPTSEGICFAKQSEQWTTSLLLSQGEVSGSVPRLPPPLLKSKPSKPFSTSTFTLGKFVKMPIEYLLPLSYDREAFTRYCVFVIKVFYIVLIFDAG